MGGKNNSICSSRDVSWTDSIIGGTLIFVPFIRKSLREKAESEGHVVKTSLQKQQNIRKHDTRFGALSTMKEMGTYYYQVNGKTYHYGLITTNGLPDTITLFYIKKPEKQQWQMIWGIGKRLG